MQIHKQFYRFHSFHLQEGRRLSFVRYFAAKLIRQRWVTGGGWRDTYKRYALWPIVAESSVWKWDIIRETLGALVSPNHDLLWIDFSRVRPCCHPTLFKQLKFFRKHYKETQQSTLQWWAVCGPFMLESLMSALVRASSVVPKSFSLPLSLTQLSFRSTFTCGRSCGLYNHTPWICFISSRW